LLSLNSAKAIEAALETVLNFGLNVRQPTLLVTKLQGRPEAHSPEKPKSAEILALEEQLRQLFNTKVAVQPGKKGGSITIYYYSDEELNHFLEQLGLHE